MALDVDEFEDESALTVHNWTQLGCSAQARPLGGHKGISLGAHELGPHLFIMP